MPQLTLGHAGVRRGFHGAYTPITNKPYRVRIDLGRPFPIDAVVLVPAHNLEGSSVISGYGFRSGFLPWTSVATCWLPSKMRSIYKAVRHSGAPRIEVEIDGTPGRFEFRVRDNGPGFDPVAGSASIDSAIGRAEPWSSFAFPSHKRGIARRWRVEG